MSGPKDMLIISNDVQLRVTQDAETVGNVWVRADVNGREWTVASLTPDAAQQLAVAVSVHGKHALKQLADEEGE